MQRMSNFLVSRAKLPIRSLFHGISSFSASFNKLGGESTMFGQNHKRILRKYLPQQYHSTKMEDMVRAASRSQNFPLMAKELFECQEKGLTEETENQEELQMRIKQNLRVLLAVLKTEKDKTLNEHILSLFSKILDQAQSSNLFEEMEEMKLVDLLELLKMIEQRMRQWGVHYDKNQLDGVVIAESRKRIRKGMGFAYGRLLEYLMKENDLIHNDLEHFGEYVKSIEQKSQRGLYNFSDLNTLQLLNRYVTRRIAQGKWEEKQQHYLVEINLDIKKLTESIKSVKHRPFILSQRVWALLQLLESHGQDNSSLYTKFIVFVFNYMNTAQDEDLFFSNQNQADLSNTAFNVVYFEILPVIMANLESLNIRDLQVVLEGLVHTFARINKACPELEIILEKLRTHLKHNKMIPAPLIMSVLSSLRFLRYEDSQMAELVIERISQSKRLISDAELLIYAGKVFCNLGQYEEFRDILKLILKNNYETSYKMPKLLVELLYSMSETQIYDTGLLDWCLKELTSNIKEPALRVTKLSSIYHRKLKLATLALQLSHPSLYEKYELERFRGFQTDDRQAEVTKISNTHKRFMLRFIELGYEIETEKEIKLDSIILRKDLYLPELNLIVELDGPPHYKLNKPTEKMVQEKLEERLLKNQGYRFFNIGKQFQEQLLLQTSEEARGQLVDRYLLQHQFPEYRDRLNL